SAARRDRPFFSAGPARRSAPHPAEDSTAPGASLRGSAHGGPRGLSTTRERGPMTSVATVSRFEFDPPGPGCWTLDTVHFPRPVTRYWAEMHPEPFRRGTQEFGRLYGL